MRHEKNFAQCSALLLSSAALAVALPCQPLSPHSRAPHPSAPCLWAPRLRCILRITSLWSFSLSFRVTQSFAFLCGKDEI